MKAKLITDRRYYRIRKLAWPLIFVVVFVQGILVVRYTEWVLAILGVLLLILAFTYQSLRTWFGRTFHTKYIELTPREAVVIDFEADTRHHFPFSTDTRLKLIHPEESGQKSLKEAIHFLFGGIDETYLEINSKDQTRRFDFVIESSYQIHQLRKLKVAWSRLGITVATV